MAGTIDMIPEGGQMSKAPESTIPNGGGSAGIDIWGGGGVTLSHTPVSSIPTGKSAGTADWVGKTDLLNHSPVSPYGAKSPADKGEV